jgi:hypothetical protein
MDSIPRIRSATVLTDFTVKDIDLMRYFAHGPIFEPPRKDPAFFHDIRIEHSTIAWRNEADIDPETLYYDLGPDATEEEWQAAMTKRA